MKKYLLYILIISFVFLLTHTAQVATYAGEIENAREEVRNNPDDAGAHATLGLAYFNAGRYGESANSFVQALKINPNYAGAWCGLGRSAGMCGDNKTAMTAYQSAISVDPYMAPAYYDLGLEYLLANDRDSAMEQYKILKNLGSELANDLFNCIYKE
jgi:tetratricopeptide (TPR) repeat protein